MGILQFIKGLDIGGLNGGAEKFGLELAIALAKAGEEVHLCALYQHNTGVEESQIRRLSEAGVKTVFVNIKSQRRFFWGFYRLAAYCRKNHILLLHSHFQVGSLIAVFLRLFGLCPVLVRTAHISKEWGDGLIAWLARLIMTGFVFPIVFHAEVGVSQGITNQLKGRCVSRVVMNQTLTIYNALPIELMRSCSSRESEHDSSNVFMLGSVGRLTKRKGYQYLVQAFYLLREDIPEMQMTFVGDGEERTYLENRVKRMKLSSRIFFVGQRSDVLYWMQKMDLFVLPSIEEGLPTVVLESMLCGTPVLATDIPGTRELILPGETGWMVQPKNAQALAVAIRNIYQDVQGREKCAKQGQNFVQQFSMETTAQKYRELYLFLKRNHGE